MFKSVVSSIITLLLLLSNAVLPVYAHSLPQIGQRSSILIAKINTEWNDHAAAGHSREQRKAVRILRNKLQAQTSGLPVYEVLPVFNQPDIKEKHQRIADEALRSMNLSSTCQAQLQNFYVVYNNPERRGWGGKSTIILDGNQSDDEFRALFFHEMGHVIDLGCLGSAERAQKSTFVDGKEIIYLDDPSTSYYQISWINSKSHKSGTKAADFVSGYAAWDPFEDMSESLTYYILQPEAFRARAKTNAAIAAKLAWIETYVFPNSLTVALGEHTWNGIVPWDTTKLPYEWAPNGKLVARN